MELTQEQKQTISQWVREGASLSQVQTRIGSEFGVAMTYMDVRFLVLDLGVSVKDKPAPRPIAEPQLDVPTAGEPADGDWPADDADLLPLPAGDEPASAAGGASVSVSVDRIMKPGSLASGSVTFSDGVKASWSLDRFGRLALDAGRPDYRPGREDLMAFQTELQSTLARQGY